MNVASPFKNMEQLEAEMTCAICLEIFEKPLILPCGHNFCRKCLLSLACIGDKNDRSSSTWTAFNCPSCRQECGVRSGVMSLPENKTLTGIVECFKRVKAKGPGTMCISHPEFETTMFCKTCRKSICLECVKHLHGGFGHIVKYTEELISEERAKSQPNIDELKNVIQQLKVQESEIKERKKQVQIRMEEQKRHLLTPINTALSNCSENIQRATAMLGSYASIKSIKLMSAEQNLKKLEQLNLQLTKFLAFNINGNVSNSCSSVDDITSAFLENLSISCDEAKWVCRKGNRHTSNYQLKAPCPPEENWSDKTIPSTLHATQGVDSASKMSFDTSSTHHTPDHPPGHAGQNPFSQQSPSAFHFESKNNLFTVGKK